MQYYDMLIFFGNPVRFWVGFSWSFAHNTLSWGCSFFVPILSQLFLLVLSCTSVPVQISSFLIPHSVRNPVRFWVSFSWSLVHNTLSSGCSFFVPILSQLFLLVLSCTFVLVEVSSFFIQHSVGNPVRFWVSFSWSFAHNTLSWGCSFFVPILSQLFLLVLSCTSVLVEVRSFFIPHSVGNPVRF